MVAASLWDLFLGIVFYLSSFFTHIHLFRLDPSAKVQFVVLLILDPSLSSSPHKDHPYYDTEICFTLIISVFFYMYFVP